jgi:hypothetical protein
MLLAGSPITIPLTPEGEVNKLIPEYMQSGTQGRNYHVLNIKTFPSPHEFTKLSPKTAKSCNIELNLEWNMNVDSPIYSAPVIFPSYASTDKKHIFVNTLHESIELIEGDGNRPNGWPVSFGHARFFGSPLVYDVDGDGQEDVGALDYNANLFFVRVGQLGEYLEDYHIQIPRLHVRKDWMSLTGERDGYTMISMFDRVTLELPSERFQNPNITTKGKADPFFIPKLKQQDAEKVGRRLREDTVPIEDQDFIKQDQGKSEEEHFNHLEVDRGDSEGDPFPFVYQEMDGYEEVPDAEHESPSEESPSLEEFESTYSYGGSMRRAERYVRSGIDDGMSYYMSRHYADGLSEGESSDLLSIEPHALAPATMADIDQDGFMEIILPISYFIDPINLHLYPNGTNAGSYYASALLCYDLQTQEYRWSQHLDLSTNLTGLTAQIYSQPTVVDLDGDGRYEVLLGTALGMLYVFDADSGFPRHHFPMQLHSIHADILAVDLLGSPALEMIACDLNGNLLVISSAGEILYDVQLPGAIYYTPTLADMDGNGIVDIILSIYNEEMHGSVLYVLAGDTGAILQAVALPALATITAPIVISGLTNTHPAQGNSSNVLDPAHLLVTTLEGHVYLLHLALGSTSEMSCMQSIDSGAQSYTPVLLDDVTSDGYLDLLIANLAGDLLLYKTTILAQNHKVWNSIPRFRYSNNYGYDGISLEVKYSVKRNVRHAQYQHTVNLSIPFTIADQHCLSSSSCRNDHDGKYYKVMMTRGSARSEVLWQHTYHYPGHYIAYVPMLFPQNTVLLLSLQNELVSMWKKALLYIWLQISMHGSSTLS